MLEIFAVYGPVLTALLVAMSVMASAHALLNKRDVRAAIGWVGIVWLVPLFGAALYLLFGINRIRRRATRLRPERPERQLRGGARPVEPAALERLLPPQARNLAALAALGDGLSGMPLVAGNRVVPLDGGDAAYPAMLEAIEQASRSILLSSYIFDQDPAGLAFADALGRAAARGVAVRVLIDGLGSLYSWPPMVRALEARGVPCARFLYSILPWRMAYLNLRNHRKILAVDGRIGFTGGMNLRAGHQASLSPRRPLRDVHFRLEGPVVEAMAAIFAEDWQFTTGERLGESLWQHDGGPAGPVLARAIDDGPDDDLEVLVGTLQGALGLAARSVRIVTPYLLPDRTLIAAFRLAVLRGVDVELLIPESSNLPIVDWAAKAQLAQLLEVGCRVWLTPPPFDHAKLMVVDGAWSLVGSTNWDPRSLRLNFELDVECFDPTLAAQLEALIDRRLEGARQLSLDEVEARGLPVKLRDGIAWLFSPYL